MKGKERCTLLMHPEDAKDRGVTHGEMVKVTSATGSIQIHLEVTENILKGVVSIPHGFGHDKEGVKLKVATKFHGASINDLTSDLERDEVSGNAAFNTTKVKVQSLEM